MVYLIVGFLVAIGWYLGKLIYEVVSNLLFRRLFKPDIPPVEPGKEPEEFVDSPGDDKEVKEQSSFM